MKENKVFDYFFLRLSASIGNLLIVLFKQHQNIQNF